MRERISKEEKLRRRRIYNAKYNSVPENKEKKLKHSEEYRKRPEVIARASDWRARNKQRIDEYCKRNKDRTRARKIEKNYGISIEQYSDILKRQRGVCAICSKLYDQDTFHVDHDHVTGKVRGILCRSCNFALGFLGDKKEILLSAIKYLKKHE